MSAFLISDATINAILTFAQKQQLVLPHPHDTEGTSVALYSTDLCDLFGRELLRENIRSLHYRYSDRATFGGSKDGDAWLARYHFQPDRRGLLLSTSDPVALIKATHCYDYQSCECPDYLNSWAATLMTGIREALCHHLPGYGDAPWGLDAPTRI